MELKVDYDMLSNRYSRAMQERAQYGSRIDALVAENNQLKKETREYRLLRKVFGDEQIEALLDQARVAPAARQAPRWEHRAER